MTSKKNIIPVEDVKRLFDYRADGALIWRERPRSDFTSERTWKTWNTLFSGVEAGGVKRDGYRHVRITLGEKSRHYMAHRLVFAWHRGCWPEAQIDHIDHNRLNNQISNLRAVSHAENLRNKSLYANSSSGVTGVGWHKRSRKWRARIMVNRKLIHLGLFDNFENAVAARKSAEKKFGFHRRHGLAQ